MKIKKTKRCSKCKDGRIVVSKKHGLVFCGFCGLEYKVKVKKSKKKVKKK